MKWFRMYTSLVDSIKVGPLKDGEFRVYVELLCLAGEKSDGGRTGVTGANINWRLRRDVTRDVTAVVTSGLVTIGDGDEYIVSDWDSRQARADSSAERTRNYRERKAKSLTENGCNAGDGHGDDGDGHGDGAEKNRGEERREEVNLTTANAVVVPSPAEAEPETPDDGKFLPCPHDKVVALYHEALPVLPRIREWTAARQQTLRSRWRAKCAELHWSSEADGIAWFSRFFAYVSESEFLCGRSQPPPGRTPFVADLEWLLKPANFTKVVEGKYHA